MMFSGKQHHIRKELKRDFLSKVSLMSSQSLPSPGEELSEATSTSGESLRSECMSKSPISHWKIADSNDIEAIYNLIDGSDHTVDELFYQPDVPNLIEKSAFAIVQFNSKDDMISFTCAFAYPNIPAVPSFEWFQWIIKLYNVDDVTPRNSFFIHYMVWRSDYYGDFLGITLETIFMEFPFLKNIIIMRPPLVKIPEIMVEYFMPVFPVEINKFKWKNNSVQILLLCPRHSLLNRLKIRLAIAEDHDDLMPIIERQTDKLRALYGDFCMAEIIEYPGTEDRKTLVCEVMGYAVAFMNVNRAIDLDLLNSQFDLGVFHGLRKPTEDDKSAQILEDDKNNTVYLPKEINSSLDLINSDTMECILNWKPIICETNEESEPDEISVESIDSNGITTSLANLIRDSLNVKIKPKFSVHALDQKISNIHQAFYNSEYDKDNESVKTELSLLSFQYFNLPEYHGPSNAFCIELFAVHEDFDEKLCTDFLEAAFELFPDLEYCLLTIPSQCSVFPLLDLFIRVTPRPLKRFKQELYVCHKSSIMLTFMRVRRILKSDLDQINKLLEGITKRNLIYPDIINSCLFPDSAYQGFVLVCGKSIVGVAALCNESGLEYLATHYRIEDLINFELHKIDYHAILKHLVLSPIFQQHARFFLRDIMRMADITALYRARYEEVQDSHASASLVTVLDQFVPVKPRRMVKYHEPSLGQNMPPSYLPTCDIPFSLYHINSRICGIRKFTSNINLVVVGASRTAYSFLENLLYAPNSAYVTYNNITWVSPHGTGSEAGYHYARDLMFPYRGKYDRRYKAQINLLSFVNFVYGLMTAINRTEKYIIINHEAILRYDYLVLLCGKQNLMPVPYFRETDMTKCSRSRRPRCSLFKYLINQKEEEVPDEAMMHPSNVFLINSMVDATNALVSLQYMLRKRKDVPIQEKIIIYGYDLTAYLCIQSLLKFGISSQLIVFVEPSPKNYDIEKVFMDPQIDEAVTAILKELEITHYRDYYLYNWTFCEGKQVKTVTFHSKHRKITLKCMAMFPFGEKLVSDVTFKAVNEASIVYDGRLVINKRFQTNDPYIYSAGSCTKYQKKYLVNDKNHEHYSSTEIGKLLAEIIRSEIDPTEHHHKIVSDDEQFVPELKAPIVVYGQLPGDWNYFRIRKPGKIIPLEAQYNVKEYGDTLITGDCKMSQGYGYFRIDLDDFGFVNTIICFTKDEIDVENLTVLYGKHERYLNNLFMRFDLGIITDFYSYFRQPWIYALYHDRFNFFMKANENMFINEKPLEYEMKIIDLIESKLKESKWRKLSEEELNQIRDIFETSNVKKEITKNIVEYLMTYDEAFTMYATSGILRVLFHGADTSLLHMLPYGETSAVEPKDMVDLTKCKVTHLGTEYIGKKFITELNETCQYWSSSVEKEGKELNDASFPDGSKNLARNYCRNPNNAQTGPWCYISNKNQVFDSCAIPLCKSTLCRITGPGMEYAGNITKSASGRMCTKWKSSHELKKKEALFKNNFFPDGSAHNAENKCRNPNGKVSGPWCYVKKEDSKVDEVELCDIPFCDDIDPIIYSESDSQSPYFFFSSFNITSSIKFDIRLWDEGDWLRSKIHILLSGIDVAGKRNEIRRWNSGLELILSNTVSELRTSDEIEVQETPHILTAMNWTNVEITWIVNERNKMLVQVFLNRKIKPLLLTEIDLRDKILGLTSFRYFSLSGSPSLWNISSDDEECNVHTTPLLKYTRFWLMRRISLGLNVDLYVRAVSQAVVLFRTAPMISIHQVEVVIGDGDKIKVAYYGEDNTYVVIKENTWPKLLDFWKWENFKLNFLKDRLQVYWTKPLGTELVMDVTHPRLAGVVWVTFGSPYVSYWTIFCNPKGFADPPRAVPPECVTNEKDDFNGTQSVTKAGHQCIPWIDDEAIPERYRNVEIYEYYGGRAMCQNFCRNLDKQKKGSFCIIRDVSTHKFILEYCYPRLCHLGECKLAGTANDYTGTLNRTRSKKDCRFWTEFSNDPVINVNNFPDPELEDAKNYCRNPDKRVGGLWCYTKDPQTEMDYCFIKDCDKPLECTILSSGFSSGHNIYILPTWRKNGLNFWVKTWNPDIYEGLKIKLMSLSGDRSYVLAIGDEGNEKLKFFYESDEEDVELLVKTLLHLVPAGKWGGFWLRPGEGKVELGYQEVSNPFFEWTSPNKSKTFDPAFIDFGTITGHWIGVNFLCSECITEKTSSENARRIYPINLWKGDTSRNFRSRLILNFRGMASLAIILMTNPGFDEYIAIKLSSDWDEISIWEFKWNYSNRKLVQYETIILLSQDRWTEYEFSFQESSISLKQDKSHIFKWQNHRPLLLYWFSIQVYEGSLIWSANCPPADIDGPPRNGHWGAWGPWACSVTCGGGQGRIERKCDNPAPNVFGRECKGNAFYDGPCNTFPCGQISPGTSDLIRFYLSTHHTALEVQGETKVVLQCSPKARNLISKEIKNVNITWILNGFPYSRRRARINKEYSLVIPKTSEQDSGVYLCMVYQQPGKIPSKLVLDVISLVVNRTTPTKKVRKGTNLSLKCNGLALSYVYGDLAQKWEVNGTVWKDYGITTLETVANDKVINVTEEHEGVWTCVITQPDLNFKWITNWMLIKVNSASNFWTYLTEDVATAPLFGKLGSEKNVKIVFSVVMATILAIVIILTVVLIRFLRSKKPYRHSLFSK